MANVDLSLDDIIQKRYSRPFNRGRGGMRRDQQRRLESRGRGQNQNNATSNKRTGPQGRGGGMKSGISDARLRIIQKNRQKLTDAREKLVQIAKQSDARLKLEKLRERRREAATGIRLSQSNMNITRRTGRNGQITLTTGRKPGLPTVIRRTVTNDLSALPPPPLFGPPMQRNLYTWVNPVSQDSLSPSSLDDLNMRNTLMSDHSARHRSSSQPTNIKVVAHNVASQKRSRTLASEPEWSYESHSSRRGGRIEIVDSDDEGHVATWQRSGGSSGQIVGRMSSELKARLDSPSVAPRSMGILASSPSSSSSSPTPSGHRIVVSNLQPSVTHEDIRELFEDIGPLMTSRLVRPGTAEVVYENHKDAVKAVDVYHNRQLDGQPMKCMLVNTRPPTTSASGRGVNRVHGVIKRDEGIHRLTGGNSFKLPSGGKSSVVPDVGTIHKALFNKS